mmetsp:Transcript_96887/g.312852  ORF Transcript_96887/g.312852 Transcript_96887/m.312852 type:complete len:514 (+) Transcript_96887:87-1628(+)
MAVHADVPKPTQLYSKLSSDHQAEFQKIVIDKLRTLIGGYGELSVLAEYIGVMLQSNRPPEQIQQELEAFLQEQSRPFTAWLCDQLARSAGEDAAVQADVSKGEALLLRAVRDARQGAAAAGDAEKRRERAERSEREHRSSRPREKRSHAVVAAAPAERVSAALRHRSENHRSRSRQRSRPRRRHRGVSGAASSSGRNAEVSREALREVPNGNSVSSRDPTDRKAVLTPNLQFLRDAYHSKALPEDARPSPFQEDAAPSQDPRGGPPPAAPDTRWHFRADPLVPAQASLDASANAVSLNPAPAAHHVMGPPPPLHQHVAYGPLGVGPPGAAPAPEPMQPLATSRPRHFPPKKWRVVRANTLVRATEDLNSEEVRKLQEGEIVEQVSPSFKLKNGIIRIQIRHPSSPQFPNPIGWVTQDATAAGGPKFLEPGPEPMARGWRPPAWSMPAPAWRPRGGPPGATAGMAAGSAATSRPAAPVAPRGPYGFQNLIWKPSGDGATSLAAGSTEPVAASS